MSLFKFKASVEFYIMAKDREEATKIANSKENPLRDSVAFRFTKIKEGKILE